MSLVDIKPYIRSKLNPAGFREWKDALNVENIPSTRLHKAYHIELSNSRGDSLNQHVYQSSISTQLTVFLKGIKDTDKSLDLALELIEDIIVLLLDPTVRVTQPNIKSVFCESFNIDPIDSSNDNSLKITMNFSFLVIINVQP